MRRTAVLSALVLTGGLLGPSTALAAEDELRWLAEEDHFAIVLPDGETFTGDEEPMLEEELPPIGSRLFISEVLYATEDGTTRGDEVGRTHIECTAQVVPVNFLCDIAFVLDSGSQLHGSVLVDFGTPEDPAEQFQFDIPVTGGSGDFFGATGVVSLTDVTDPDDPEAPTETLYEADVKLAHD
jgi:hypothetical protein